VALAGASGVLFFSGFLIGLLTVLLLRIVSMLGGRSYEAFQSQDSLDEIHKWLHVKGPRESRDALFLSATLDHELLPRGIHEWILRRWSMFYACANSAMGLILGWVVKWWFSFRVSVSWWSATVVAVLILVVSAFFSWRDAQRMIEFQSRRLSSLKP